MHSKTVSLLLAASLLTGVQAVQARDGDLDQRVQRLEQLMQSRGLVEMLTQLEQLQREVQQLRGQVEVQGHTLEQLKQRQRDLYLDIDRRLQQLETAGPKAAMPDGNAPSVASPDQPAEGSVTPPATAAAGDEAGAPSSSSMDSAKVRQDYQQALNILREGRYMQAAESFRDFLKQYPDSGYAANAQYWLAESFYVTRQFPQALEEFSKVVNAYPDSNKVADARLKIGFIHYEMSDWQKSRQELEAVTKAYPGSTAARLAEERLQRLQREGH